MKLIRTRRIRRKADKKDIVVELNGIEDRIVRLTPNSSDLGSAILSKDGENLFTISQLSKAAMTFGK